MALSNALNPTFEGPIQAKNYKRGVQCVPTNGTTEIDIWTGGSASSALLNGFNGSVVAVQIIPTDTTAGEITVYSGNSTGRVAVAKVAKPATLDAVYGSVVTVSGVFTAAGTLTAVSSSAGNAVVEVIFTTL